MTEFQVGDVIRIHWSNDHGYSEYRIADNPGSGPHILEHLRDYESQSDGSVSNVFAFEQGKRYRLWLKRDQDRKTKTVVMDFMSDFDREMLFSARPVAGTQTIPRRWLQKAEMVDTATPIQLLK